MSISEPFSAYKSTLKVSKKQKEKDNLKKLESNWDRYDLEDDDEDIGRSVEDGSLKRLLLFNMA